MSSIPPGTRLNRDDVVGRRLVAIHLSDRIEKDEIEFVYAYFQIDSGAKFFLSLDNAGGFLAAEPSHDCTSMRHRELEPILGQRIVSVLRMGPDDDIYHDSPYLVMENGYVITHVMAHPVGLEYAGLHVYAPGIVDTSKLVEFFT